LMPESLKSVSSFDLLDVSGFFMPFMLFMVTRLKCLESTWCLSLDRCQTGPGGYPERFWETPP